MLKRFFSIISISLIISGSFFSAYSFDCPVYADSTTDEWINVTTNDQLAEAFRYYCKSRDLTIEGSFADGITSFTTNAFNGICKTLGIDITALQAQIKYQTDGNLGTRFLFTATGVDVFNRIFAQFLQDNDLEVGDTVNNLTLYSGQLFTDYDGYTSLCYMLADNFSSLDTQIQPTNISSYISANGTFYKYTSNEIVSLYNNGTSQLTFNISSSRTINWNIIYTTFNGQNYQPYLYSMYNYGSNYSYLRNCAYMYDQDNNITRYGYPAIFVTPNNTYWLGTWSTRVDTGVIYIHLITTVTPMSNNVRNGNIYITTNNKTINNNTYEGDTIINNEGDIINNNPSNPNNPDLPSSNPTIPDSGGWEDFQLPNMPNDWLIYGMEKKFPFDIPFNIMFGLSLLNHEPEIPKFEGDIDLKVCTWHYDIDLTPFDDIAKILRKFEVLAFIIGLAILTKELIMWG